MMNDSKRQWHNNIEIALDELRKTKYSDGDMVRVFVGYDLFGHAEEWELEKSEEMIKEMKKTSCRLIQEYLSPFQHNISEFINDKRMDAGIPADLAIDRNIRRLRA